jgi:hypothetical protein
MYHISREEIVPSAARAAASAESERGNTRKDYGEERYQTAGYCWPDGDGCLDTAQPIQTHHIDEKVQ